MERSVMLEFICRGLVCRKNLVSLKCSDAGKLICQICMSVRES